MSGEGLKSLSVPSSALTLDGCGAESQRVCKTGWRFCGRHRRTENTTRPLSFCKVRRNCVSAMRGGDAPSLASAIKTSTISVEAGLRSRTGVVCRTCAAARRAKRTPCGGSTGVPKCNQKIMRQASASDRSLPEQDNIRRLL